MASSAGNWGGAGENALSNLADITRVDGTWNEHLISTLSIGSISELWRRELKVVGLKAGAVGGSGVAVV